MILPILYALLLTHSIICVSADRPTNIMHAKTWDDIFKAFDPRSEVIEEQYKAHVAQQLLPIAHHAIRSVPIVDNNERLVDIRNTKHPRISMLPNAPDGQPFAGPQYNAGFEHSSKMRHTLWVSLVKMIKHLDGLSPSCGYQPGSLSIKVFEGLRDLESQQKLFDNKLAEIKKQNPSMTDEAADRETATWVSPTENNVPAHSTGAAIDIRLWNSSTKDFVDTGTFGVIWGPNDNAHTFSANTTPTQKRNRLLLLTAADRAGLTNYTYKHWHFSTGDRYAVYWQEKDARKRQAHYGPAQS